MSLLTKYNQALEKLEQNEEELPYGYCIECGESINFCECDKYELNVNKI